MAGTKGFDPEKDRLLIDYGTEDLEGSRAVRLQVKSYDGAEPKLEILKMARKKDGSYTPAKGMRLSLDEARTMVEMIMGIHLRWEDFADEPVRK